MNSKNISTKRLERENKEKQEKAAENADLKEQIEEKKRGRHAIIKGHRDNFYNNLKNVFIENAEAQPLPEPKKVVKNDIIKKNLAKLKMQSTKNKVMKEAPEEKKEEKKPVRRASKTRDKPSIMIKEGSKFEI